MALTNLPQNDVKVNFFYEKWAEASRAETKEEFDDHMKSLQEACEVENLSAFYDYVQAQWCHEDVIWRWAKYLTSLRYTISFESDSHTRVEMI